MESCVGQDVEGMLLPSGLIFDSEEAVWIGGVGREHHEEHEDEYEIEEASSSCARIFHWNKQHLALSVSVSVSVSLRPRRLQRNRQPFQLSARSQPIQRVRVTSRQISTRDNKTLTALLPRLPFEAPIGPHRDKDVCLPSPPA